MWMRLQYIEYYLTVINISMLTLPFLTAIVTGPIVVNTTENTHRTTLDTRKPMLAPVMNAVECKLPQCREKNHATLYVVTNLCTVGHSHSSYHYSGKFVWNLQIMNIPHHTGRWLGNLCLLNHSILHHWLWKHLMKWCIWSWFRYQLLLPGHQLHKLLCSYNHNLIQRKLVKSVGRRLEPWLSISPKNIKCRKTKLT